MTELCCSIERIENAAIHSETTILQQQMGQKGQNKKIYTESSLTPGDLMNTSRQFSSQQHRNVYDVGFFEDFFFKNNSLVKFKDLLLATHPS